MAPAVLFLPGVAASIHYRPHEQPVSGSSLLEVCLRRIRTILAGDPIVLVHEGAASPLLQQNAEVYGCCPLERRGQSEIAALQEAADLIDADLVLSGRLELSLAPRSLPLRHWEWHKSAGLAYSAAVRLPERVSWELVSVGALRMLGGLNIPGAPTALRPLVQAIEQFGGAKRLGLTFPTGYFDARLHHPGSPADLPVDLAFETPQDIECATVALLEVDGSDTADEWSGLTTWKRQRILQSDAACGPRRAAPRSGCARVLFVSNPSACSGAEESLCQVVKHLDRKRYLPSAMVALEGEFACRLRAAGADVHVPNRDFGRDCLQNYQLLAEAMATWQPDVMHVNAPSGMPLIYAAWERRIPIVAHVRQSDLQGWTPLLQAAQKIVAVSGYIRGRIVELDVEPSKITVVYDGVDPTTFFPGAIDRRDARLDMRISPDAVVLLCVARYVREKRLDLFCELLGRLRDESRRIEGIIVGDPNGDGAAVAAQVTRLIENLGLVDSIHRVVFQRDIRNALAAADAIVLCSEREPLGTCVLEAFAMGVPAVVTRSGGLAELIDRFGAGVLVNPGSIDALSEGMRLVLDSEQLRGRVVSGGLQAIRSQCNSRAVARTMMDCFDEAMAIGSCPPCAPSTKVAHESTH
jgi:glycosyltransferase involved in cell wall biosynthesis